MTDRMLRNAGESMYANGTNPWRIWDQTYLPRSEARLSLRTMMGGYWKAQMDAKCLLLGYYQAARSSQKRGLS